jgi:hypothetical protein
LVAVAVVMSLVSQIQLSSETFHARSAYQVRNAPI